MDKTGSLTYIGLVYEKKYETFRRILQSIFNILNVTKIDGIRFSFDSENWTSADSGLIFNETLLKDLYNSEMFDIEAEIDIKDNKSLLTVSKEVLDSEQAIMLGFYDNCMFKSFAGERGLDAESDYLNALKIYTDFCIDLVKKICSVVNEIEYAFCDNDAMLEYRFKDIQNGKSKEYSLVFIPEKGGNLKILKSNWEIDGMTKRKK